MLLLLLEYNITVQYTPGKEMHIADTLLRNYLNKEPPSTVQKEIAEDTVVSINTIITDAPVSSSRIDKIREECARDEEIQLLCEYLHKELLLTTPSCLATCVSTVPSPTNFTNKTV